ncbi:unknown [Candidatus Apopatosoma intestinale]|nr:unknown [Candidatus Apopatosoma intestinale]
MRVVGKRVCYDHAVDKRAGAAYRHERIHIRRLMEKRTEAGNKEFLACYHDGYRQQELSQRIVYGMTAHIHDGRQGQGRNHHLSHADIQENDGENRRRDEPFQPVILMLRFFIFRCRFGFGRILFYAETAFCDLFDYHFGRDLAFVVADDELACGQIDIGALHSVQLARDTLDGTAAGGTRHT